MNCRSLRLLQSVLAMIAGLAIAIGVTPVSAQTTLLWSGNGSTQGGAGTWDTTLTRWGTVPAGPFSTVWNNSNLDSAVFGGTAGAVTLGATIDVGGLQFNTTGFGITTTGFSLDFEAANNSIVFNNIAAATITGPVGGSGNVTLSAANPNTAGTLTLNGTSTGGWSGTTTVNSGMTLALAADNQGLNTTTGITLNGGGITLTNTSATAITNNRVSNSAAITSNGGTFTYTNTSGTGVYAETIGSVALTSGQLNFNLATNQTGAGSQTLTLSGLTRIGATNSSAVTFSAPTTAPNSTKNRIVVTGAGATPVGQIIGPWATTGTAAGSQTDYAVYDSSSFVVPASIAGSAETTWTTAANAYTNALAAQTLTANRTIAALRNTGATATLTLASGANLETFGVLNGAATLLTIAPGTGGVLTTPTGGGNLYLTTDGLGTSNTGAHNGINVTAPINDNSGAVTLVKSGVGVLQLNATSNYSGGTVINAGTLWVQSNASLGNVNGDITFNGSATLLIATDNGTGGTFFTLPATRSIIVNNGAMATIAAGRANANPGTINSDISGTGGVTIGRVTLLSGGGVGNYNFALLGTNTFTGALNVGTGLETSAAGANNGLRINTLADSTAPITLNFGSFGFFDLASTAPANLSVPSRPVDLRNSNLTINNLSGSRTMTLGAVSTTTAGAKTLSLGAGGAGGIIAGNITNGAGTISVSKTGTGAWTLSGTNTYTGNTIPDNSTLTIRGKNALPTGSIISFDQSSGSAGGGGGRLNLYMDDAGSVALGNQINVRTAQTSGGVTAQWTIDVGNNGGATTGSTLVLGTMNFASITDPRTGGYILNVTGANGYGLQIGNVNLAPNVGSAGGTGSGSFQPGQGFNPTTAPLTITGTVRQNAASVASGANTGRLVLWGTNAGNSISGAIMDPADFPGNPNAKALGITKGSTGNWSLTNTANTFTSSIIMSSTTTSAGTLSYASAGGANPIIFSQTTGNATLSYIGSGQTMSGAITASALTSGTITLDASGAGAIDYSNTGSLGVAASGNKTLILSGTNTGNNTLAGLWVNNTTGNATLTKNGVGKWILTGANTYTGATTINGGTLAVNGSLAAGSTVTVNAGGTLGGDGDINGSVIANGSVAPGNSIGTLVVGGNLTWNAGDDWVFELGPGDTADLVDIAGAFTRGTGADGAFMFDFAGSTATGTFVLVDFASTTFSGVGAFDYTNLGGGNSGSFNLTGSQLQFVVVPEPAAISLASLGLAGIAYAVRRSRRTK